MNNHKFNQAIGAAIMNYRKQRGMTQSQVAEKLGVRYQQLQKYESGKNSLAAHAIPAIAEILGVTVADLYEQAGVDADVQGARSPADNDLSLIARYLKRVPDSGLRSLVVDLSRKVHYLGAST